MNTITFSPKRQYGIQMYFSKESPKFSVYVDPDDKRYYIRIWDNNSWVYPSWEGAIDGFRTLGEAQDWLNRHDWEHATSHHIDIDETAQDNYDAEFKDAMKLLGLEKDVDPFWADQDVYKTSVTTSAGDVIDVRVILYDDVIAVDYWVNNKRLPDSAKPADTANIAKTIRNVEKIFKKYGHEIFANTAIISVTDRVAVMAAVNTKDLAQHLVKVRSSNVWAYGMNIKNRKDKVGDLLVQFKGKQGGPGDIYIYYDVPVVIYRRWQSAPSKGHYFWVYIRNNYKYSKLTGDKRGKLHNAVN